MPRLGRAYSSALFVTLFVSGCGGRNILDDGTDGADGGHSETAQGGVPTYGRTSGQGGVTGIVSLAAQGGVTVVVSTTASGGNTAFGSRQTTGGTIALGGTSSLSGALATGGTTHVGGITQTGGSTLTGATTARGGSTTTGGTSTRGGATFNGGSTSSGGSTVIGGATWVGRPCPNTSSTEWYVNVNGGLDVNPGTAALPFATLQQASLCAQTGHKIWLLPGTYGAATEPMFVSSTVSACGVASGIVFANDVTIEAVTPRTTKLVSTGYHGLCMKGGALRGLTLSCGIASHDFVRVPEGDLVIENTEIGSCGRGPSEGDVYPQALEVLGTAAVKLIPGTLTAYSYEKNVHFAVVREQGSLSIEGGTLEADGYVLTVQDNADLSLKGVTLRSSSSGLGITARAGSPTVRVTADSQLVGFGIGVYVISGSATVTFENSSIAKGGIGIELAGGFATDHVLKLVNSSISENGYGLLLLASAKATIEKCAFLNNTVQSIIVQSAGAIELLDSRIANGPVGPYIYGNSDTSPLNVRLRNVEITGMQNYGLGLSGNLGPSVDLGTLASPGGNHLHGNGLLTTATYPTNLLVTGSFSTTVNAVGNTWTPLVQGADAAGQYVVTGADAVFEFGNVCEANVCNQTTASRLIRVAENPL